MTRKKYTEEERKAARCETSRKCRLSHPEKVIQNSKQYRAKNPEKVKNSYNKWRATHVEQEKARGKRRYAKEGSIPSIKITYIVRNARRRAKKRKIQFDEKLFELFKNPPTHCPSCRLEFEYAVGQGRGKRGQSPSLDRFNNNEGYTLENTKIICWKCNSLKADGTLDEIRAVYNYVNKTPFLNSDFLLWV